MPEFKFFDRGERDTILLIPGWASDYRIFSTLDLRLNYLVPMRFSPFDFEEGLLQALEKNGLKKISILGWSMGAFLAADALSHNRDRISELILVSARKKYEKCGIDNIKMLLEKNKDAFLYKFYNECFSKEEKSSINWFKKVLLKDYLNDLTLDLLLEGLEYLSQSQISPERLSGIDVKLVHGENDRIAPIEGASELKNDLARAKFFRIEGSGHIPFLNPSFERVFLW